MPRAARRGRGARAERADRRTGAAGRDADDDGPDLSSARRLRQGARICSSRRWRERHRASTAPNTSGSREALGSARRRARAEQGRLRRAGARDLERALAHAARAARRRRRGSRRHAVGARTRLPGCRVERSAPSRCIARRSTIRRSALGHRSSRDGGQRERSRVGAAPERRSRRRRGAAAAVRWRSTGRRAATIIRTPRQPNTTSR